MQHVDGRARVGESAMYRLGRGVEEAGERAELAVGHFVAGEDAPREHGGVDDRERRPGHVERRARVAQEAHVERCVVGHEHAATGELEEGRQHRLDARRHRHHGVGDAGEHADERRDRHTRVDQGLELAENLAGAHLHRADLGDRVRSRGASGGLQVDDGERGVAQGLVELVEALLEEHPHRCGTHDADVRRGV